MDPAEIPGGVDTIPSNTSCTDVKMQRHCPPPPQAAADVVSRVLDDDDVLIEIIVRLGLPTALVRAIFVCKRWFGIVSQKAFLRRFRNLHPPRLLGFYVSTRMSTSLKQIRPHFVPMSPQPPEPEVAAAARRAESYSLDAYQEDFTCIYECQNDTIFVCGFQGRACLFELHWPLCPKRGVLHIPMCPHLHEQLGDAGVTAAHFLLKDEGDGKGLTYIWFSVDFIIEGKGKRYSLKYKAHIYMLQDGLWRWLSSATAMLHSPRSNGGKPLLSGNKIYMENCTSIVALDLTASSFSTIPLPEGMDQYVSKDMILSRANDSEIYLIHLEKLQLRIWLHGEDSGGSMRNWLLVDTICLPEMLDALGMSYQASDGEQLSDDEQLALLDTNHMGDNLQFVFLKLGKCALYLDIKRRELHKVYEVTHDRTLERIHPFMMTWPPTFPVLKDDPARFVFSFWVICTC